MLWRIGFVSLLFAGGALAAFFHALGRGLDQETARTLVVNLLVVFEIFYLFNVRYLHSSSISLRGVLGTPAVLIALIVVIAAQLAFTYLPLMHKLFETRPLALAEGVLILCAGVLMMLILELEKAVVRRFGLFDIPPRATVNTAL